MDARFEPEELVPDRAVFGPALQRVRGELGVSQKDLGEHAVIASSTIATYETGHRDPSPEAIVGIAVACGVEPWSAALHGRLLLSKLQVRRTRPSLRGSGVASAGGLASAGLLGIVATGGLVVPLGAAVGGGLAAAQVARAARRRSKDPELTDVAAQKLLSKAEAARPLPAAERLGTYALIDAPPRPELKRALLDAADTLDDDQLLALVVALQGQIAPTSD